jgi:GNAT superfamily N-acetyltransferase
VTSGEGEKSGRDVLDVVATSLEMTSPADLRPGREAPQPIKLETVSPSAPRLVRATYVRIWKPLAFSGRMEWSDTDWTQELSRPGVEAWLARVGDEIAGLVELEADAAGSVGIVVFGLVPEFIGRGFGGPFLTLVTRLAWAMPSPTRIRRVWLQTYSSDHPHAITNYIARGFRVFQSQTKRVGGASASGGHS